MALSRVEFDSSIRVVFDNTNGLKHLFSLKYPKSFDLWINNYCGNTGQWLEHGMEARRKSQLADAIQYLQQNQLGKIGKTKLVEIARVLDIKVEKNGRGVSNKPEYVNALYDVWIKARKRKKSRPRQTQNERNRPAKRHACAQSVMRTSIKGQKREKKTATPTN